MVVHRVWAKSEILIGMTARELFEQLNITDELAGIEAKGSSDNSPDIRIDQLNGKNVVVMKVHELSGSQKPLYFKSGGLPRGGYWRIGPQPITGAQKTLLIIAVPSFQNELLHLVYCSLIG